MYCFFERFLNPTIEKYRYCIYDDGRRRLDYFIVNIFRVIGVVIKTLFNRNDYFNIQDMIDRRLPVSDSNW